VATAKNRNQVVKKLSPSIAESMKWAIRQDLQFVIGKTEETLFSCRSGHEKHLLPKLTTKI
jgi:hypothetical protein